MRFPKHSISGGTEQFVLKKKFFITKIQIVGLRVTLELLTDNKHWLSCNCLSAHKCVPTARFANSICKSSIAEILERPASLRPKCVSQKRLNAEIVSAYIAYDILIGIASHLHFFAINTRIIEITLDTRKWKIFAIDIYWTRR